MSAQETGGDGDCIDVTTTDDFAWTGTMQLALPEGVTPGLSVHHEVSVFFMAPGKYCFTARMQCESCDDVWCAIPCFFFVV